MLLRPSPEPCSQLCPPLLDNFPTLFGVVCGYLEPGTPASSKCAQESCTTVSQEARPLDRTQRSLAYSKPVHTVSCHLLGNNRENYPGVKPKAQFRGYSNRARVVEGLSPCALGHCAAPSGVCSSATDLPSLSQALWVM